MGAGAVALMGTGAALNGIGSYYGAQNQKTQLGYEADIADINARMSENSAQQALRSGQVEEENARLKTAQLKSSQNVALAANGVDLAEGSAVNLKTSTDVMGEVDANTIAANAIRSAWGYRTQATNYSNEAKMKRAQANGISPGRAAINSMLTGAAATGSEFARLKSTGAAGSSGSDGEKK